MQTGREIGILVPMHRDWKTVFGAFASFFKIGAFTIGGGYAMLPLIEHEFVERKKWVSRDEIVDIFAIAQSLPGVIAINTSIFIGYRIGGVPGALIASAGMILPSFLVILVIAAAIVGFQDNPYVQRAFAGVRAGVTALILLAAVKLGRGVIKSKFTAVIALVSFTAIVFFDIHAAWIILASAAAGLTANAVVKAAKR